ncbi:MAG: hypothetical protein U0637_11275 [Phycisphaerales bacterium]
MNGRATDHERNRYPDNAPERRGWWCALLLCLAVWATAAWFLRGGLGRWNDDFFFHWIDPQTQAPAPHWVVRTTPFFPPETGVPAWRPLFFTLGPALNTLLWRSPAAMHTCQALLHLGMVCALAWLAAELGLSRRARIVAALIAIPCAPAFETVFWTMAWPSTLATALTLLSLASLARASRTHARAWQIAAVLCALPVPLLNEQPAGAFLAMPLIALAARAPGTTWARAARRHAWVVAAVLLWCVLYAARLIAHETPAGTVGASGEVVHAPQVPRVAARLFSEWWKDLVEWRYIRGSASSLGRQTLRDHPAWSLLLAACTAAAAVPAARWLTRRENRPAPRAAPGVWWAAAIALAMVLGAMVPLVAVDSPLRPRMLLCSWLAFALLTGACVDAARAWISRHAWPLAPAAWPALAALAWLVGAATLSMVGVQRAYQDRWLLDQRLAANFRAAMPDPPPGTVFFMLSVRDRSLNTGNRLFDDHFFGALACSWSYPTFLQWAYARPDIECETYKEGWAHLSWADENAYVPVLPMRWGAPVVPLPPDCPPMKALQVGVPWERSVFVDTAEDGSLSLVEEVEVHLPTGRVLRQRPPRGESWRGARTPLRVLQVWY